MAVATTGTDDEATAQVLARVRLFYQEHTEIKVSHGLAHVLRVYDHACRAIAAQVPPLTLPQASHVRVAALLHDVDDGKYFPHHHDYEHARAILAQCDGTDDDSTAAILDMVAWVSCSKNGNRVPERLQTSHEYFRLIPRWADRLEAVGAIGVLRCFQYNQEHGKPLQSADSPRAQTEDQVWALATPDRFENYLSEQSADKCADDMISHYYDKLLHVARPPPEIVRNAYLEEAASTSAQDLVEVCLRFGRSGCVDVKHLQQVAARLGMSL
jgi:uncharacterized protein